jgi:hypothetical protein
MRQILEHATSWETPWSRDDLSEETGSFAHLGASGAGTESWWAEADEGYTLLQRLALAHLCVGVCVALALGWQEVSAGGGQATSPAIGLIVAIGGALALLSSRLDRSGAHILARLALVAVDLSAAGGILWMRGGAGWTLLVLLPPVALAVAFFAERGGALATGSAALLIVAANTMQHTAASGWMPSLLVFLGVAVVIVAFLGIYSAQITASNAQQRRALADEQAAAQQHLNELHRLRARLRALEQVQEPLLHERQRSAAAAAELTILAQRMASGDAAATQFVQTLRPGSYGPLAELASALVRLARMPAGSWNIAAIAAIDVPARGQTQALDAMDTLARALCVDANEMVVEAQALEPGISLIGSRSYTQALWQLEEHLRAQSAHLAVLGMQLADMRILQQNVEIAVARASGGAKTPSLFATSDIQPLGNFSGPQITFGASAIRRAAMAQQGEGGTVRWGDWQSSSPITYNKGV